MKYFDQMRQPKFTKEVAPPDIQLRRALYVSHLNAHFVQRGSEFRAFASDYDLYGQYCIHFTYIDWIPVDVSVDDLAEGRKTADLVAVYPDPDKDQIIFNVIEAVRKIGLDDALDRTLAGP